MEHNPVQQRDVTVRSTLTDGWVIDKKNELIGVLANGICSMARISLKRVQHRKETVETTSKNLMQNKNMKRMYRIKDGSK